MSKYPGLLIFNPISLPPMPWPWDGTASMSEINAYTRAHPGGDMNEEQQILNNEAVHNGNLLANAAVVFYNNQVVPYWDNGGPENKWGMVLPTVLPVLEQYYKPATDARIRYDPATGTWSPSGPPLATAPWTLPAGTVLYTIET